MNLPQPGDYIDIHIHGGRPAAGIFMIESLMAHEDKKAEDIPGIAYTYGIHPWFLDEKNHDEQIASVRQIIPQAEIIAVGEAGFDKLRGPSPELQRKVFEEQVIISETYRKPLIVHCVRGWDDLLAVLKQFKPKMPWMVHGFRGSIELAEQLLSKGLYLSVWFDFALRTESASLLRSLSADRLFLETDGADVDIRYIYNKVSKDRGITVDELKKIFYSNFRVFFNQ